MLVFTPNAQKLIKQLPDDKILLLNIWKQLERIEQEPEKYTEKAVSPPFPEGRLMSNFQVIDGEGHKWGITILVQITYDEESPGNVSKMIVTSFNAGSVDYLDELMP